MRFQLQIKAHARRKQQPVLTRQLGIARQSPKCLAPTYLPLLQLSKPGSPPSSPPGPRPTSTPTRPAPGQLTQSRPCGRTAPRPRSFTARSAASLGPLKMSLPTCRCLSAPPPPPRPAAASSPPATTRPTTRLRSPCRASRPRPRSWTPTCPCASAFERSERSERTQRGLKRVLLVLLPHFSLSSPFFCARFARPGT